MNGIQAFSFSLLFAFSHAAQAQESANEVVVVGTRTARPIKDSPVVVRVVDRKEIEAGGDASAAEAVTRVVGVHVDTALRTGQTPQIQGFGSKHVLVLIDGRRVGGRLADDFDLSRIPASSIERIEILKGASSVLYGSDAIGGVINVVTRKARPGLHGNARVSRDSLHRNDVALGVGVAGDAGLARLDGSHQTAPTYDLNKDDVATTGNAYERNNAQLDLRANATDRWEVSTTVGADEGIGSGVSLGAGTAVIDLKTKGVGRHGRVGTRYRTDDDGEVRLDVSESRRTFELLDNERGGESLDRFLESKETSRDAALLGSLPYAGTHRTTAGIDAIAQTFESNQLRDDEQERTRNSVFLQHEWKPFGGLSLVPGVRHDVDSQFDEHLSRAFAIRYDLTSAQVLRLSYGEGYRAPSFSELYLSFANMARGYRVEGNEELEPETSKSLQLSLTHQPSDGTWLSVGLFGNRVEDLIATTRRNDAGLLVVNYDNVDSVRTQGIEASWRRRIHAWTLGLDYTYLEATDEQRHRMLEGRPMHSGAIQTRHEARSLGLTTSFSMSLVGKRPYYTEGPTGTVTDWSKAYRSGTFRVAKSLAGSFEVFTGVKNLTDEGQERFSPLPPRSYFGGAGAEF